MHNVCIIKFAYLEENFEVGGKREKKNSGKAVCESGTVNAECGGETGTADKQCVNASVPRI